VRFPELPDDVCKYIDGLREEDIPDFIPSCPITLGVLRQPALSTTSQTTYEYEAICEHLDNSDRSPSSNKRLSKDDLVPDRSALRFIEGWARDQMQKDQNKRGSPPGGNGASKRQKLEGGSGPAAAASASAAAAAAAGGGGRKGEGRKVIDLAGDDDGGEAVTVTAVVLGRPPAGLLSAVKAAPETVLTGMMQWFGELHTHAEPSDKQVAELKKVLSRSTRVERAFREWLCSSVAPNNEATSPRGWFSRPRTHTNTDDSYSRVANATFKTGVSAILREIYPGTT